MFGFVDISSRLSMTSMDPSLHSCSPAITYTMSLYSSSYKRVIAVVGFNPNKKYPVTPEQRKDLLEKMLQSTEATNVDVAGAYAIIQTYLYWTGLSMSAFHLTITFSYLILSARIVVDGYIWRYAKRHGATMFFRGIRSWENDGSDERSLQILNTWGPILLGPLFWPIPTYYLEGDPKYNHVSSTLIRKLCNNKSGTDNQTALGELVPANVADLISKLYCPKDD